MAEGYPPKKLMDELLEYWDDEVERRVNGRRRALLLELRAHTFK